MSPHSPLRLPPSLGTDDRPACGGNDHFTTTRSRNPSSLRWFSANSCVVALATTPFSSQTTKPGVDPVAVHVSHLFPPVLFPPFYEPSPSAMVAALRSIQLAARTGEARPPISWYIARLSPRSLTFSACCSPAYPIPHPPSRPPVPRAVSPAHPFRIPAHVGVMIGDHAAFDFAETWIGSTFSLTFRSRQLMPPRCLARSEHPRPPWVGAATLAASASSTRPEKVKRRY